jgi:hypothetical protein
VKTRITSPVRTSQSLRRESPDAETTLLLRS